MIEPSIKEIQSRVEAGAKFLDSILDPTDWPHRIDLDTLDINSCGECMFGQIEGDFYAMKLMHDLSSGQCQDFGFLVAGDEPDDGEDHMLDQAWHAYVTTRLSNEHAEA